MYKKATKGGSIYIGKVLQGKDVKLPGLMGNQQDKYDRKFTLLHQTTHIISMMQMSLVLLLPKFLGSIKIFFK